MAQGIQGEAMEIILNSRREGTKKQYTTYISQWAQPCRKKNVDQTKPSLAQILGFLAKLSSALRYSAVATARSALSSFIQLNGMKLGDHPLVTRFMTGLFNKKPALPRYVEIWNPQSVLEHLRNYPDTRELSLKQLTTYCSLSFGHSTTPTNTTSFVVRWNEGLRGSIYVSGVILIETVIKAWGHK